MNILYFYTPIPGASDSERADQTRSVQSFEAGFLFEKKQATPRNKRA